ncbi:MAG: archease [candidate division WOR-3 bacterium]|nr:MAG: archease [candidate division WOR-3 bacterium]
MTARYRQLEHTSDIRVAILGKDLPELFSNAAFCLFDIMLDISKVRETKTRSLSLESTDLPELLMDWLRELLFLFSNGSFVPARVAVRSLSSAEPCSLSAELSGETYDPDRHRLRIEVKTPTYHQYELKQTEKGWQALIVLDV